MEDFRPENNLLPHVIDHYAQHDPERIYAEYPRSPDTYKDGFTSVSYKDLANAINGIALWLRNLTRRPGHGEALAYFGPNDIRYPALVFGALKAGYCMFLVSPRNSMAAYQALFERTKCRKFLTPSPRIPQIIAIIGECDIEPIEVPSVEELLSTVYPHVKYCKTYPDDRNDIMAIVHTSGSTGIPKPIVWPLEVANQHIRMSNLQPPSGSSTLAEIFKGSKMFLTLPPFHAAGIGIMIFVAVPSSLTLVLPISGSPPTAASFVEAAKVTAVKSALLPPFILNELAHNEALLDFCGENLDFLMYGGGDLPQPIGDTITKRIKLANVYGASELGILSALFSHTNRDPSKDWKYVSLHPEMGGEFRHVMEDKYELVLVKSEDRERHQMPFGIFPELDEYPTRDLFIRHPDPSKSDMWRWCSRFDDVIVFLNGEKTNPISMEQHITASNQKVTGVLVAGAQRFQASLIIEYGDKAWSPSERAKLIEELWPVIEEANSVCPAHAQISRNHILFTTPDKPMLRAGKGTIQRTPTLALYESELDALYADADSLEIASSDGDFIELGDLKDVQNISEFIRRVMITVTGWSENELNNTTNFFHFGLDSLKTITAARSIRRGLHLANFTPNLIYLNPSVTSLAQATVQLIQDHEKFDDFVKTERLRQREMLLKTMIDQIDHGHPNFEIKSSGLHTVVLTGSTGSLGTYILDTLLKDPTIGHIHCLNRRKKGRSVQDGRRKFYHLKSSLNEDRVSFWHVDLSQKDLGLDTEIFNMLQDKTTVVFHNAWNVNFNLSLTSFEPDLLGLVNLINFTASSKNSPRIFFVSSISSVLGHSDDSGLTPEAVITTDLSLNGYADSKYIAEHIIDHAVKKNSLRASIARVGQVAGAVKQPGLWNKAEWFPSLVISSNQIKAIPHSLGPAFDRIDWVPVDLLAGILVDLALDDPPKLGSVEVFHPLNLHPRTWDDVTSSVSSAIKSIYGTVVTLETVPLSDWIQRVRKDMEAAGGEEEVSDEMLQKRLERNPAAKLLDFFEAFNSADTLRLLDTQNTAMKSRKLHDIDGVRADWIHKWVWEFFSWKL